MVLARPDERKTCPYHCSLRLFTIVRRSSCAPIACWILARTSSLVTWSLYETGSLVSCGSTSFPWLVFFFGALLWGSMIHNDSLWGSIIYQSQKVPFVLDLVWGNINHTTIEPGWIKPYQENIAINFTFLTTMWPSNLINVTKTGMQVQSSMTIITTENLNDIAYTGSETKPWHKFARAGQISTSTSHYILIWLFVSQ